MSTTRRGARTGGSSRRRSSEGGGDENWGRGGSSARSKMAQEREEQEKRRNTPFAPFRFFLRKGEEREITILDASLEDVWCMYEHDIPGPKNDWKNVVHEPCPREFEDCPFCMKAEEGGKGSRFKRSRYVMVLTIIVPVDEEEGPYVDKGGVEHWGQKRLLVLTPAQEEDYGQIFEAAMKKFGTLRGLTMLVKRSNADQSPRVGKPSIMEDGELFFMMEEEDLIEDFGHDASVNDKGEVMREEDEDIAACDYAALFPKPSAKDILRRWPMLRGMAGSQADIDETMGDEDEDEDEAPRRSGRRSSRSRREKPTGTTGARARSRRGAKVDVDDDPEDEEEDEAPRSRSRRRSRSSKEEKPASRSRSRGRSREPEPEEDEDDEEEERPRRGRSRSSSRKVNRGARTSSRRSRADEELDDEIPF